MPSIKSCLLIYSIKKDGWMANFSQYTWSPRGRYKKSMDYLDLLLDNVPIYLYISNKYWLPWNSILLALVIKNQAELRTIRGKFKYNTEFQPSH